MRLTWLLILALSLPAWGAAPLRVAVAANFRAVLEQLNPAFEVSHDTPVTLSSASTGVLYSQLRHGAPFDIFLAADADTPRALEHEGQGVPGTRFCYARGRLALIGARDFSALADPSRSLAIANPATAPYGRAALEVLARESFQNGVSRKQVLGNNAVQAWQFQAAGAVDLALVPGSLSPGSGLPVPAAWHEPIEQEAVLLQRAAHNPVARAYLGWLREDGQRRRIEAAGYDPCP